MKKVGIITFHSSINYGVYLQAYALQHVINKMGFSAEIIDYNKMIEDNEHQQKRRMLYRLFHINDTIMAIKLRRFRASSKSIRRKQFFSEFSNEYFNLSKKINSYQELKAIRCDYDFFVCGSDQVWNPNYTKGNPAYFLAFAETNKRIMYAPSYGVKDITLFERYQKLYKTMINELHGLSVRETSGIGITEQLSGRTPEVVVDPTLLLSATEWRRMEIKPDNIPEKYILFYILGNDKRYPILADNLSCERKMKIVSIPMTPIWEKKNNINLVYASINHFLYLIDHAECIITDSFHGVVFSTIFRKNFTALKREDTPFSLLSRIEDYLEKVNLLNNYKTLSFMMENTISMSTDYISYEYIFSEWQKKSYKYLRTSLT